MSALKAFNNPEFGEIRGIEIDGGPWLVGKDVAIVLGYSNTKDAIEKHVDEEDKRALQRSQNATFDIPNRGMTIINESGLYCLALSSKLPGARKFRRLVTKEVIPSIRKHGAYITPDTLEQMIASPEFGIRLLTALKEEQEKRKKLEMKVMETRPQSGLLRRSGRTQSADQFPGHCERTPYETKCFYCVFAGEKISLSRQNRQTATLSEVCR